MVRPTPILFALLLLAPCCLARVQESQEAVTAGAIAAWTRMCMEQNDGKVPTTWPEYRETLKFALNDVLNTTLPTRRYGVMDPRIPLQPPLQGEIVVITRKPIEDTAVPPGFLGLSDVVKGPGRYVIYKTPSGEVKHQWMDEDEVVETFAAAKIPLPDQDDEPERPWVTEARSSMMVKRMAYSVGLLVMIVAGFFVWKNLRTPRTKAA